MTVELVFVLQAHRGLDLDRPVQVFADKRSLKEGLLIIRNDEDLDFLDPNLVVFVLDNLHRQADGHTTFLTLANEVHGTEEAVLKLTVTHLQKEQNNG